MSLLVLGLALPVLASDHTPPPIAEATSFPAVEVHDKEQVAIAREMVASVRSSVQGVQVSAPFGKYHAAAQVLGLV